MGSRSKKNQVGPASQARRDLVTKSVRQKSPVVGISRTLVNKAHLQILFCRQGHPFITAVASVMATGMVLDAQDSFLRIICFMVHGAYVSTFGNPLIHERTAPWAV